MPPKKIATPTAIGAARGYQKQQRKYNKRIKNIQGFRKDLLPKPLAYLASQEIRVTGKGEWRDMLCPFHADTRPSLRININSGGFRCMACGAHGGDILSFHMQAHKMDFATAAKSLGAWGQQ